jgi:hypothetical protein
MALAETTFSAAVNASAKEITVASAASISAGRLLQASSEIMQVAKNYTSGTTVPVLRGQFGTVQQSHASGERIVHGDAADFSTGFSYSPYTPTGRSRRVVSYTGTAAQTCELPRPGEDLVVVMNGSAINTLTVPVPTKDLDGCTITLVNSAAAAHIITFTGGLGGAGSSYDVVTLNASGTCALQVIACNEVWCPIFAPAMGGTVTNLIGTIA